MGIVGGRSACDSKKEGIQLTASIPRIVEVQVTLARFAYSVETGGADCRDEDD